jgi:hypothetical protein
MKAGTRWQYACHWSPNSAKRAVSSRRARMIINGAKQAKNTVVHVKYMQASQGGADQTCVHRMADDSIGSAGDQLMIFEKLCTKTSGNEVIFTERQPCPQQAAHPREIQQRALID